MDYNKLYNKDCLSHMKKFPDNCIDLAFCDPPYNLEKAYDSYYDDMSRSNYLDWCEKWLDEYVRLIKKGGSIVVLNMPQWASEHVSYLSDVEDVFYQNWFVWDAMSVPRGKVMPAHYSIIHFSKGIDVSFKEDKKWKPRKYCNRDDCNYDAGEESFNDFWNDIHRIKHSKDRDSHPCQLPSRLLERIILGTTEEEDVVLDCMMGVGTTPKVAQELNRQYIGIEISEKYYKIAKEKIDS